MKKIIILSCMLCLIANAPAHAQVLFGEPYPAYVAAPVYVSPTPVYPTYAVEGERYHAWHDHGRYHPHHRHDRHDRHDWHRH